MKKRIRIIVILALVAGLLGWAAWHQWQGTHFRYAGTLEADDTDISPGVVSQVQDVPVVEGQSVKAGDLLVKLQCQEVRINAANANTDFNRARKLFAAGSMPQAQYDKMRYAADNANLQVSFCDIAAPIDSVVTAVYHRKGEWVRPGMNLLTLEDLAHPYAYIYVSTEERAKLKLGDPVQGFLVGNHDQAYAGRISYLRPDAEFTPKNVQTHDQRDRLVYGVKVTFENPDGRLTPGLPIEVKLTEK